MKKLLVIGLIVPMAVLLAFGSVSLADEPQNDSLNQELNQDLNGTESGDRSRVDANDTTLEDDAPELGQETLNNSRGSRSLGDKRGRMARRGQTAVVVAGVQNDEGDDNSGKSADEDEDEDDDVSPTGN